MQKYIKAMVRLGYACINTVLRKDNIYTNRTCRLAKIKEEGIEVAKELGRKNITDMKQIIQWNEDHGIRFYRVSSDVFPFASEMTYQYKLDYVDKELKEVGELAKKYGHRLTTHPGQYNVLCSPNPKVVEKAFVDLAYQCEMLDRMGCGPDSVMIIHMGGAYGDKDSCYKRFEENFLKLPKNVRDRLVLENDEVSYKVEELLPTCKKLKIPLVLDWHHDKLNPSTNPIETYLPEINAIWKERGIKPKQHYSESANGHPNPRTHSDYIKKLPPCAGDMDLMIEAKMKEQTVLRICRKYDISPDTKVYPTSQPKALPDDAEVEDVPSLMLANHRGRKKHDWTGKKSADGTKKRKRAKKGEEEEEEEDAEEEVVSKSKKSKTVVKADGKEKKTATKKKTVKKGAKVEKTEVVIEKEENEDEEVEVKAKSVTRKSRGKKHVHKAEEPEEEEQDYCCDDHKPELVEDESDFEEEKVKEKIVSVSRKKRSKVADEDDESDYKEKKVRITKKGNTARKEKIEREVETQHKGARSELLKICDSENADQSETVSDIYIPVTLLKNENPGTPLSSRRRKAVAASVSA